MDREGKLYGEDDDKEDAEGAHHIQIEALMENEGSSLSGESYLVDFSDCHYFQEGKNWSTTRDTKSLLTNKGSTFSCFNNPKMLINIRKCKKPINGVLNCGVMVTNQEGDIPGDFPVYYNPKSLMSMILFKDMRKRFRITVDTDEESEILVHISENRVMKFVEISADLYIWKPEHNSNLLNKQMSSCSFLVL